MSFPDDSGYEPPYHFSLRQDRLRQGSRALESDNGQDAFEQDESSSRRMPPAAIVAPAPDRFLNGFDIEQYDMAKTPSPANVDFSTRIDAQLSR